MEAILKSKPSGAGQRWTEFEESTLLEEIAEGLKEKVIATNHNRTVTGIIARIHLIAYRMYENKYSMIDIMSKTGLTLKQIEKIIKENSEEAPAKIPIVEISVSPKTDILELKSEVSQIKKDIAEILRIMNAIYDFETQ